MFTQFIPLSNLNIIVSHSLRPPLNLHTPGLLLYLHPFQQTTYPPDQDPRVFVVLVLAKAEDKVTLDLEMPLSVKRRRKENVKGYQGMDIA